MTLVRSLPELVKKIRQANVWEEFFEQYEIEYDNVMVGDKPFLRYKLYEATYFPLTTEPLLFPALGLQMLKFQLARHPGLFGFPRKEEVRTYYSSPRIVEVKPLPEHPLKDQVPVGSYQLKEGIETRKLRTGRGFHYWLQVEGEGNIAAIQAPEEQPAAGLEIQPPTIRQLINRSYGRVTGHKSFDYFITPREPGTYDMGAQYAFIFFNPATARYDTLRPQMQLHITGPSHQNEAIAAADLGTFYELAEKTDNDLISLQEFDEIKRYANLALLVFLLAAAGIYFFRRT